MRTRFSITTTVLIASIVGCFADTGSAQRRRSSWRDRAQLENVLYKSNQTYETKAIRGGEAVYSVYLPKNYDDEAQAEKRYPVIYFLHGMNEDHNRFHSRGGSKVLDQLTGQGAVPEMIFVCAYDGSRRSFYVDNERAKVESMIVRDLVKHVDATYRTRPERAQRAILGVSMGGFGALKIALKNATVFGAVATHSAAILPAKYSDLDKMFPWAKRSRLASSIFGSPVDEKRWAAENPLTLATAMPVDTLKTLQIYFDCGTRDRYGLDATNVQFHELLKKRKVPHSWKLVEGGTHGWNTRSSEVGYNTANLPNSLRFLAGFFARKAAAKSLSGMLGGQNGDKDAAAGKAPPEKPGKKKDL